MIASLSDYVTMCSDDTKTIVVQDQFGRVTTDACARIPNRLLRRITVRSHGPGIFDIDPVVALSAFVTDEETDFGNSFSPTGRPAFRAQFWFIVSDARRNVLPDTI